MTPRYRRLDALEPSGLERAEALLIADARAFARAGEALEPLADRAIDPARRLWVAELDGAIVGILDAVLDHPLPGTLTVAAIAVLPSLRRRGVGRALIIAARAEVQAERGGAPHLGAGVHEDNWVARAFFARLGFVERTVEDEVVWMGAED